MANHQNYWKVCALLVIAFVVNIFPLFHVVSAKTQGSNKVSVASFSFKQVNTANEMFLDNAEVQGQDDFKVMLVNSQFKEDIEVIPGGHSLGIEIETEGVLVVGHYSVHDGKGDVSPGKEAKVQVGDTILSINNRSLNSTEDLKTVIDETIDEKGELELQIKRGKNKIKTNLQAIKDAKTDEYQIGLYVRDSVAGIGTLTFYDPVSKRYGALGHVISDIDTKQPIPLEHGQIVRSSVSSIRKSLNGSPGEKQANFSSKKQPIGTIIKNSPYGIFGKLSDGLTKTNYDRPIPIALSHEVQEGPATILTVVDDEEIEEFSVEITSSTPQNNPETKGMIVKVTDPKLLEKTGGIVQGMSGSPIIQDGKLIGAITHVFVNDATSGYGVHIEWMLDDAGVNIYQDNERAS